MQQSNMESFVNSMGSSLSEFGSFMFLPEEEATFASL